MKSPLAGLAAFIFVVAPSSAFAASTDCVSVPNGDFDEGTEGWFFEFETFQEGDGVGFVNASIADGTGLFDPLDAQTLRLDAVVFTGSTIPQFGFGNATAEVRAHRVATITNRMLHVRIGGGFEWEDFGGVGVLTKAIVRITPAPTDGKVAEAVYVIRDSEQPGSDGCGFQLAVLGVFGNEPAVVLDMLEHDGQPTGLEIGQDVFIEVIVKVGSSAIGECQGGSVFLSLYVDEFEFCDPEAGSGIPGDVTGDGIVNVDDLLAVINYWGLCPVPNAAALPCQVADIAPQGPPAGDGMVNVDDLLMVINNWTQ